MCIQEIGILSTQQFVFIVILATLTPTVMELWYSVTVVAVLLYRNISWELQEKLHMVVDAEIPMSPLFSLLGSFS